MKEGKGGRGWGRHLQNLGRQVIGGPHYLLAHLAAHVGGGQPKVHGAHIVFLDGPVPLLQQEVLRLQVPVQDPLAVAVLDHLRRPGAQIKTTATSCIRAVLGGSRRSRALAALFI